jgi:hypothetical protein
VFLTKKLGECFGDGIKVIFDNQEAIDNIEWRVDGKALKTVQKTIFFIFPIRNS